MEDDTFLTRFAAWEAMPGSIDDEYYPACEYPDSLDAKFDTLCALYLEVSNEQRQIMVEHLASQKSTLARPRLAYIRFDNLILGYMRRISKHLLTTKDSQALRLGLAAAAIVQEHPDYRDVIISLSFLHLAARKAGIDPVPYFTEVAALARPQTQAFILDFLTRGNRQIDSMVEAFGAW